MFARRGELEMAFPSNETFVVDRDTLVDRKKEQSMVRYFDGMDSRNGWSISYGVSSVTSNRKKRKSVNTLPF